LPVDAHTLRPAAFSTGSSAPVVAADLPLAIGNTRAESVLAGITSTRLAARGPVFVRLVLATHLTGAHVVGTDVGVIAHYVVREMGAASLGVADVRGAVDQVVAERVISDVFTAGFRVAGIAGAVHLVVTHAVVRVVDAPADRITLVAGTHDPVVTVKHRIGGDLAEARVFPFLGTVEGTVADVGVVQRVAVCVLFTQALTCRNLIQRQQLAKAAPARTGVGPGARVTVVALLAVRGRGVVYALPVVGIARIRGAVVAVIALFGRACARTLRAHVARGARVVVVARRRVGRVFAHSVCTDLVGAGVAVVGALSAVAAIPPFVPGPALGEVQTDVVATPGAHPVMLVALLVVGAIAFAATAVIPGARGAQLQAAFRYALDLALRLVVAHRLIVRADATAAAVVRAAVSAVALGYARGGFPLEVRRGRVGDDRVAAGGFRGCGCVFGDRLAGAGTGRGEGQ